MLNKLEKQDLSKVIKFINKNFSDENTKSSQLNNYKMLIYFMKKVNISFDELVADELLSSSNKVVKMVDVLLKIKNFEIEDEIFEIFAQTYKINNGFNFDIKDLSSVKIYLNEISQYRRLTDEEVSKLSERIKAGDQTAVDELIVHNLKLVVFLANIYRKKGYDFEEAISNGNEGLIKAAYKFDSTKGYKFSSYAVWWIKRLIIKSNQETKRTIRYPVQVEEDSNKIKSLIEEYQKNTGNNVLSYEQVAKELNLTVNRASTCMNLPITISINTPYTACDGDKTTIEDIISDENVNIEEKFVSEEVKRKIRIALKNSTLDERSKKIILIKFFSEKKYTDEQIGRLFNISGSRVQQIIKRSLDRLKINKDIRELYYGQKNYQDPEYLYYINSKGNLSKRVKL